MKKSILTLFAVIASLSLASCNDKTNTPNASNSEAKQSTVVTSKLSITVTGSLKTTVGSSVQLKVTLKNDSEKKGYTATSSDESIATVSETGLVTGVSAGNVKLTFVCNSDESVKKEIDFTVVDPETASVEIQASSETVAIGEKITLKAVVKNKDGLTVTYKWKSTELKGNFNKSTSEEVTYTGKSEGEDIIELTCKVGDIEVKASINIQVTKNMDSYVRIGTAEEFKSKLLVSGRLDKDYILTADIDLGNMKIDGYGNAATFAGTLNGNGHKISNFEIISSEPEKANSALWQTIDASAVIEKVEFDGKIGAEGVGWGSAILGNVVSGTIQDCLFRTEQTYNNGSDAWFPFAASIAGVLKESAVIKNCVVDVTGEGRDVHMAVASYPAGGSKSDGTNANYSPSEQTFVTSGIYTSQAAAVSYGSDWEWGCSIEKKDGIHCGINFSTAAKSTYSDLNESTWNLQDNVIPTLKIVE